MVYFQLVVWGLKCLQSVSCWDLIYILKCKCLCLHLYVIVCLTNYEQFYRIYWRNLLVLFLYQSCFATRQLATLDKSCFFDTSNLELELVPFLIKGLVLETSQLKNKITELGTSSFFLRTSTSMVTCCWRQNTNLIGVWKIAREWTISFFLYQIFKYQIHQNIL